MNERNPDEIAVEVWGKWGDAKFSLTEWIKNGPNKLYPLQGFSRAYHKNSGVDIPLQTIPYPFRNDEFAARLILDGVVNDPWKRDRELLQLFVELITEYDKDKHEENFRIIKSQFLEELSQTEKLNEESFYQICWKIADAKI